jgi:hypothetical protein
LLCRVRHYNVAESPTPQQANISERFIGLLKPPGDIWRGSLTDRQRPESGMASTVGSCSLRMAIRRAERTTCSRFLEILRPRVQVSTDLSRRRSHWEPAALMPDPNNRTATPRQSGLRIPSDTLRAPSAATGSCPRPQPRQRAGTLASVILSCALPSRSGVEISRPEDHKKLENQPRLRKFSLWSYGHPDVGC